MRKKPAVWLEKFRDRGELGGETGELYGRFIVTRMQPSFPFRGAYPLIIVVSAGDPSLWVQEGLALPAWEHVSVSWRDRTPTWTEMCAIKAAFWRDEEAVMQLHPPKSEYVNHHPHTLHLWRPIGVELPRPPASTVGPTQRRP